MNTLQAQIAARIEEAQRKNIRGRACIIAETLGYGGTNAEVFMYQDLSFEIRAGNGWTGSKDEGVAWSRCEITFGNQLVYKEVGGTISSYIPGAWEVPFTKLYADAEAKAECLRTVKELEKREAQKHAEAELRKKWGL